MHCISFLNILAKPGDGRLEIHAVPTGVGIFGGYAKFHNLFYHLHSFHVNVYSAVRLHT